MSFESRNKAVEYTLFCKTSASISTNLNELKTTCRKLISDFTDHCNGEKDVAKARLRLVRSKKKIFDADSSIDSDDDSLDYEDSQQSKLLEICDLEDHISNIKVDLETILEKKKETSNNLKNNN